MFAKEIAANFEISLISFSAGRGGERRRRVRGILPGG